jgi:putative ABC transport system substrate-binding protein
MGGAAAAFSRAARAQHLAMPVIGFVNGAATDAYPGRAAAFRKGLEESGYVDGQNVTVEYHWLDGRYDFLPALMADFVRRRVAVIATPISNAATLAGKAAIATIPIVLSLVICGGRRRVHLRTCRLDTTTQTPLGLPRATPP